MVHLQTHAPTCKHAHIGCRADPPEHTPGQLPQTVCKQAHACPCVCTCPHASHRQTTAAPALCSAPLHPDLAPASCAGAPGCEIPCPLWGGRWRDCWPACSSVMLVMENSPLNPWSIKATRKKMKLSPHGSTSSVFLGAASRSTGKHSHAGISTCLSLLGLSFSFSLQKKLQEWLC